MDKAESEASMEEAAENPQPDEPLHAPGRQTTADAAERPRSSS